MKPTAAAFCLLFSVTWPFLSHAASDTERGQAAATPTGTLPPGGQDITKTPLVLTIPGMNAVELKQNIIYEDRDGEKLCLDIYYPPRSEPAERMPAVVFVMGYSNNVFPVKLKEWRVYTDWARLVAASGFAGVLYETTSPAADIQDLLTFVRQNAATLRIAEDRLALWACSANALTAVTVLLNDRKAHISCAALYYGLLLTPDQKFRNAIVALNRQVRFSLAGIDEIKMWHPDVPLFIVRAGKDMEVFNQALDYFATTALSNNVPLVLVNYAAGRHGFDIHDDNEPSREIMRRTLDFFKFNLSEREEKAKASAK